MPPFRSMTHARWQAVTAGSVAVTALALAAGCGGASSAPAGAAPGPAAPAAGSAEPTGSAAGPAPEIPQATTVVKRFYQRYATDPAGAGERYLTAELAARVKADGARAVFCAPEAPASLTYSAPVVGDGTATVTVTARRKGAPDRRIAVTVTVPDILVSAITCPA